MKLAFAFCLGLVVFMSLVCIDQTKACSGSSNFGTSSRGFSTFGDDDMMDGGWYPSSWGQTYGNRPYSRGQTYGSRPIPWVQTYGSGPSSGGQTYGSGPSSPNTGPIFEQQREGASRVQQVMTRIGESGIFPDDKGLMRRIAFHESKDGSDERTKRPGYYGGIWQVDESGFADTKKVSSHPGLADKYRQIKEKFDIDWPSVQWKEIQDDPLKNGLAARLKLSNVEEAIPSDKVGQANYWKEYYNTEDGAGTAQKFLADVNEMP